MTLEHNRNIHHHHDKENKPKKVRMNEQLFRHTLRWSAGKVEGYIGEVYISAVYQRSPLFMMLRGAELELLDLKITKGSHTLDIKSLLLDGFRIFFPIDQNSPNAIFDSSIYYRGKMSIRVGRPLLSLGGLLVLLHEIGHVHRDTNVGKEGVAESIRNRQHFMSGAVGRFLLTGRTELDPLKHKALAKEERDAWSYALKLLRPFAPDINVQSESVRRFINDRLLGGYKASDLHRENDMT